MQNGSQSSQWLMKALEWIFAGGIFTAILGAFGWLGKRLVTRQERKLEIYSSEIEIDKKELEVDVQRDKRFFSLVEKVTHALEQVEKKSEELNACNERNTQQAIELSHVKDENAQLRRTLTTVQEQNEQQRQQLDESRNKLDELQRALEAAGLNS